MASANGGSDAPPPPLPLSRECIPLFYEGITLVLSRWTALQMAVENEWGGRDSRNKSETLASDVFTWFTQSKEPLYIDDLECILEECLLLSFNTEAEDGSVEEVAEELMIMHEDFLRGNYEAVDKLRKSSAGPSSVSQSTRGGLQIQQHSLNLGLVGVSYMDQTLPLGSVRFSAIDDMLSKSF